MNDAASQTTAEEPRKAALAFIFVVVLLDMLAFGVIIPVLPKLVERFLNGDTAAAAVTYGWMATGWALMQFVCMPILGALSDRFGRRRVILISSLGLGLDFILMALAPSIAWLFVGRLISGMTAANVSTGYAYIADVMPPEKRAGAYGLLGAAFGLGFILGPALGGVLGGIDARLPFWLAAGLALANTLYGFFVLPESLKPENRSPFRWSKANPVAALNLLRSRTELLGLATINFLLYFAQMSLPSTAVLYMGFRYGFTEMQTGLTLALVGLCGVIVQAGLTKRVVARFGERRTVLAGLSFGALGFATYGLAPTSVLFLAGIPIMALWGLTGPAVMALMTQKVGVSDQGKLQGANSSVMGLAGLAAPYVFTHTFAYFIGGHAAIQLPGGAFLLASGCLVVGLLVAFRATMTAQRV